MTVWTQRDSLRQQRGEIGGLGGAQGEQESCDGRRGRRVAAEDDWNGEDEDEDAQGSAGRLSMSWLPSLQLPRCGEEDTGPAAARDRTWSSAELALTRRTTRFPDRYVSVLVFSGCH